MGSVHKYQVKSGTRYAVVYRNPDHKQVWIRGFERKIDADKRRREVEISIDRGEYVNRADALATINNLGDTWLDNREPVLKPSTYRSLDSAWRIHVKPRWGARAVGSIRHSEVQTWISNLASTRSATTTLRAHGVLAAILDDAVKDRRVVRNVARGINLPRKTPAEKTYLTHEQVADLAAASKHPTLVTFLAYTGLRWGEATGLCVKHVDALRHRVNIVENAVDVAGIIEVGTPKTHERRSVPYPAFLALPIARACEGKTRDQLLFGDGTVHMPRPNNGSGWLDAAVRRCQEAERERLAPLIEQAHATGAQPPEPTFPRVTAHDLRHTAASLAISAGANVKAVQRMLGHASAAMTLDVYAELFDDDLDAVSDALDKARNAATVSTQLAEGRSTHKKILRDSSQEKGSRGIITGGAGGT